MTETVISEVGFYPIKPTEKGLIGFSSCLFDGKLSLNSISVYLTPDGDVRLLFPNRRLPNGRDVNIYYPIRPAVYESIRLAVSRKIETVSEKVRSKENEKESIQPAVRP